MYDVDKIAHDLAIAKVTAMLIQRRQFDLQNDSPKPSDYEIHIDNQMIDLYKQEFATIKTLCEEKL